jgi:pyruvate-ferredoxin/flavodoxin oxidoreductase
VDRDWWRTKYKSTGEEYNYTVAHWALTEGRFRKHLKSIREEESVGLIPLDDMLLLVGQDDVVQRRVFREEHRSSVPNFGVYIKAEVGGTLRYYSVSRQMVLFAVERRKAWRMLQSKAGVVNQDYLAQKAILKRLDQGEFSLEQFRARARELFEEARAGG